MDDFAAQSSAVMKWIERYLSDSRAYPVLSRVAPGEIADSLPGRAPQAGESFERIFADFESIVMPGITHWNHPRFFAYFAISSAPIAVLADAIAATLDVNAMLWRTSPAATELEEVVVGWLREMMGLPESFSGIVYDTASIAGFTALAAAREACNLEIRDEGMAGRELPPLRVYITEHTHSHIEKAAIALGIGRRNVVKIACDDAYRMRPDALRAQIAADIHDDMHPMCVVATVGTTSTTSIDPVVELGAIARRHGAWFHVDAAYAGAAAIVPEHRWILEGCERADSIVFNPHKWLFVPVDFSVLYVAEPEMLKRAFSLVADYLVTSDENVRNYMDYGLQLGRRFRALKLWFVLRYYGVDGITEKLRAHIALAQELASWIEAEPGWSVCAPHPLSVVCFRHEHGATPHEVDEHNARIIDAVNATGEMFLSGTKIDGRFVIRLAIGNLRTTRDDVAFAWDVLKKTAGR